MSLLMGKWANPEGGEIVEFTAEGTMVVSRGGEILATECHATRINAADGGLGGRAGGDTGGGTEEGDLLLRAGGAAEVVLEYRIDDGILMMGFSGQTTLYTRVSGPAAVG